MKLIIKFLCLLSLLAPAALGQGLGKHPRVIELEEKLNQDTVAYIKSRFPGMPIIVSVDVEALRRTSAVTPDKDGMLPYLTINEDEVVDEWDDPARTIHELFPRIKKASLQVQLPKSVSDNDLADLRNALYRALNLVPGRDDIQFERKDWQLAEEKNYDNYPLIALGALIIALGIFISLRLSVGILARSIGKNTDKGGAVASAPAPLPPMPVSNSANSGNGPSANIGQLRFDDPLKVKSKIKFVVDELSQDPLFPNLDDMLTLYQLARKKTGAVGAAIGEMPVELQLKIFQLGFGEHWLAMFADSGQLSIDSYEVMYKLSKQQRQKYSAEWRDLLIYVWRLQDKSVPFFQSIEHQDGLTILSHMPVHLSVPYGKKAYPGLWGTLLEKQEPRPPLAAAKIAKYTKQVLELEPLNDYKMIQAYRHERGLLEYLRTADVGDEKDIYLAAKEDSVIHRLRPPFFQIFQCDPKYLQRLILVFPVESWALALFNIPRDLRKQFDEAFNEKQRYLFIESLKALDRQPPDREQVGQMREQISKHLYQLQRSDGVSPGPSISAGDNGATQEVNNAA